MARPIVVTYKGQQAQFDHARLSRDKLYGKRRRLPLDPAGSLCQRAELSEDGSVIIRPGMTAQGYFDQEGHWISNRDLVALDPDDKPLEKVQSTLGVAQDAADASMEEILDLSLSAVYMLDPVEVPAEIESALSSGIILRFSFNYRTDFNAETAFLLKNKEGYFALVGNPASPQWLELAQVADGSSTTEVTEDELDFEMF